MECFFYKKLLNVLRINLLNEKTDNMKKIFAILLLVLPLCMSMEAQVKATPNDTCMNSIEVEFAPEFPGGDKALHKFLAENLVYPEQARENEISGHVFVTFVVEKDGSVGKPEVIRGIGGGCDEEVVRVVKLMPKWKPGRQKGKVPVRYTLPVTFNLN